MLQRIAYTAISAPRRILAIAVLVAVAAGIFGIPVAGAVAIGAAFTGTMWAPNAQVTIENSTLQASQFGAVFARRVELHQGLLWQHVPFARQWIPTCVTFSSCTG